MSASTMAALSLPPKRPRIGVDELMCVTRTEPAHEGVACRSETLLILTFGPSVMLKTTSVSPGLSPLSSSQLAKGRPSSLSLLDDGLAGQLVGDGVERHADAQAGDLVDVVVGAAEVLGAVVDDLLDEVGLVLDGEDDGDLAVRLGAVVGLDVGELAGGDEGAHVFLHRFGACRRRRPGS